MGQSTSKRKLRRERGLNGGPAESLAEWGETSQAGPGTSIRELVS